MSESPPLDLARLDSWFGVRPGQSRAEALEALRQQPGVEIDDTDGDDITASTKKWEMELYFSTDGSDRLRHVSLDSFELSWNGKTVQDVRLGAALTALEPLGPAMWTAHDAIADPFAEFRDAPELVTDERLLVRGTLWLAERRLGLVVGDGEVIGVVWREPRDFPRVFARALTETHRTLSQRPDLEAYLNAKRIDRLTGGIRKDPMEVWRKLAKTLTFAAVAAVVIQGFRESERWGKAQTVQAKVLGPEKMPYKAFRDFLPAGLRWALPRTAQTMVDGYRLAYADPAGDAHEVLLEERDVFIYMHVPGEDIPLAYVAGPPAEVQTFTRSADAGFIKYTPWVVVIGYLYVVFLIGSVAGPAIWRRLRASRPRRIPA